MDERVYTLLQTARRAADTAAVTARAAGKQASRAADSAARELKLLDLRAEINLQQRELGELLYATHTGNPTDSEILLAKMQKIDALYAQVRALRQREGCSVCGGAVRGTDTFCRTCGAKL